MQPELTVAVKNGIAFMGKMKDYRNAGEGELLWVLIERPYMLVAEQTGPQSMKIRLQELVGDPQEIMVYCPEATYTPTAKGLITEYMRSATGIVIAQSMPPASN